jgi:hypothetical protein
MTGSAALVATEPIIRARLKKAHAKRYRTGVLGLRAQPVWEGEPFDYHGTPVTVVACPSVLSIWEAIEARAAGEWTVVLTSVDDDDLGDTVLAHLLDGRLMTPDPWDALRGNFSASTIEPALYRAANDRAIANGLLAALSTSAYTPAPGGVLTRDHALSAVARDVLGIVKSPDVEIDTLAVLEWSRSPTATDHHVQLRATAGSDFTAFFGAWLADRAGRLARPLIALLASDRIRDLVPLGLVAGLFTDDDTSKAQGMFLGRYGLTDLTAEDLAAWYTDASGLVTNTLQSDHRHSAIHEAAAVVNDLRIADAAAESKLLPHGLDTRLRALANAVLDALPNPLPEDVGAPMITPESLHLLESRWSGVVEHFLAAESPTYRAFTGAMRLARWLATPMAELKGLGATTAEYVTATSWVDTALVTARRGAEDPVAAEALRAVIDACVARRAVRDHTFAAALADSPKPNVPVIENVLRDSVIPIAKKTSTLLVVIDALSMAAANELVTALQRDGWIELSATARPERSAALAVLPTLTGRSRCSLLCGELREGTDTVERSGFSAVLREANLQGPPGAPDPIFHKRALDAVPSGLTLATDVNNAIADTSQRLVAVVLNYVDDTLHHTDPGGTDWNLDTITHLRPVLRAARSAGRTVVITSDHGHIIEYGTSTKVDRANAYGQRAHGDTRNVDPDREVVVEGPRVLTETNTVVLAVNENVRYGARNAGYHGGGSPAEAVVPLVVLSSTAPADAVLVARAEPSWWDAGLPEPRVSLPSQPPLARKRRPEQEPSLFDEAADQPHPLPDNVVKSKTFASQFALAGRIVLKPPQIRSLLQALLAAGSTEITLAQAATALGVATTSVNGALMQTKRVLDVEGYEVLRVGAGVVSLDVSALKEQFGVTG